MSVYTLYDGTGMVRSVVHMPEADLQLMLEHSPGVMAIPGEYRWSDWFVEDGVAKRFDAEGVTPPAWHISRSVLKQRLAEIRYLHEISGTQTASGDLVRTGREDQAMAFSAFVTLQAGLVSAVDWKGVGGWSRMTLEQMRPITTAISQHVQKSFSAEGAVVAQIEALSDEGLRSFDIAEAFASAVKVG